jgi:hypothetical protein
MLTHWLIGYGPIHYFLKSSLKTFLRLEETIEKMYRLPVSSISREYTCTGEEAGKIRMDWKLHFVDGFLLLVHAPVERKIIVVTYPLINIYIVSSLIIPKFSSRKSILVTYPLINIYIVSSQNEKKQKNITI